MARSSVGALATAEELGGVDDADNGAKLLRRPSGGEGVWHLMWRYPPRFLAETTAAVFKK